MIAKYAHIRFEPKSLERLAHVTPILVRLVNKAAKTQTIRHMAKENNRLLKRNRRSKKTKLRLRRAGQPDNKWIYDERRIK